MMSGVCNLPIGMDDRMLAAGGTGVATYARALRAAQLWIREDALLVGASDAATGGMTRVVAALWPGARRLRPAADAARLETRDLFRTAHVHFGIHRRLLTLMVAGPPGLIHWTYPVPLRIAGWANLYTVHDAIPLTDPALTPIDAARHRRTLRSIVAGAARIVTVSEAARRDIVAQLGCPPDLVVDASQPVDLPPPPPATALPAGLAADGYLLVVGSIEPRKNIARILAAYRRSATRLPLVLAGPDGWRSQAVDAEIAATPGAVRLRGLDRPAMLALIADARLLLMPSLAEGFGLPVAEAMALGTAVIASDRGALAETAGGAAHPVDPCDVAAIAAAIARLADDAAARADLVRAGRANATRFAPAAFADRLGRLYREVASTAFAAYPPPTG